MDLQNVQGQQSMHLVLSTDAKPRLKWTPELHQRFIDAINQLGGAEKATPKSLMRVMGIPGLTLYHLKSHLQKYRLGKSQLIEISSDNNKHEQDCREIKSSDDGPCSSSSSSRGISVGNQNQITESIQIAEALQMQMEVQKKLYEQIEVQRHLQVRIEAQGNYLQSVLKKAQETLSGYCSSSYSSSSSSSSAVGLELAKAELSQLASIINNACPSSPISELTEEARAFSLSFGEGKQNRGTMCSLESSLTSSESSGRNIEEEEEDKQNIDHEAENALHRKCKNSVSVSVELPLMTIHPECIGRKRSSSASDSNGGCVDHPSSGGNRCGNKLRKSDLSEMIDLNIDSSSKEIDLNCSPSFWGQ